jgi:3',5'-cyclic AMP phosphodiesterase CpdA
MIFDPHRGDFEDDASSTKRRSLMSLAGSLLIEISLLKLALAWLIMLVAPSLLLGLAPLAATIWLDAAKWKLDRTIAEIWPAILLAAIVVAGWYVGPLLWRTTKSSFWALNSLAVEPIYLILREVFRYLFERWLPTRATDEQYRNRRAAASLLAALVICGLALIALSIAWPHTRWIATTADLSLLHHLAPVALANSTVLTAGYLALAALLWGIGDSTMAQPHTIGEFPTSGLTGRVWRIAHLSDIHVVGQRYGYRIESGRAGPQGNERFRQVLDRLASIHAENPLDAILITGDMTDAGSSAEWAEFLDALATYPQLVERVLVLPGNHDLNVADRANPARLELPTSPNRRLRQLRVLSVVNAIQGQRVRVVDFDKNALGECLADALKPHLAEMRRFADTGRPLFSPSLGKVWRDVFPLIVPPGTDDGLGMVLLNSNVDSQFSFTSALGMISVDQVRGIQIAADQFPKARWLLGLHHHLVEYPRGGQSLADRIGTALINGNWFVRRIRYLADRAVVMHGHRHIDWIGKCAGLLIVSAPSPVMEVAAGHAAVFYIHSVGAEADGKLSLLSPQKITLA